MLGRWSIPPNPTLEVDYGEVECSISGRSEVKQVSRRVQYHNRQMNNGENGKGESVK